MAVHLLVHKNVGEHDVEGVELYLKESVVIEQVMNELSYELSV